MADNQSDDLAGLMVGLLQRASRRGRRELSKGLDAGRQQLALRQARRDLDAFWVRLGKTAYRLSEAGEITHPAVDKAVTRIAELEAEIAALEAGDTGPGTEDPTKEPPTE